MSLAARRVYDSLPVRRSILGNASSSCDSGLHPFRDVLAPSSSWATPCSFSLHLSFQYLFLEPFMSLYMAKILYFSLDDGGEEPPLFNIGFLQYGVVCSFFCPWHPQDCSVPFELKSIYFLFRCFIYSP